MLIAALLTLAVVTPLAILWVRAITATPPDEDWPDDAWWPFDKPVTQTNSPG